MKLKKIIFLLIGFFGMVMAFIAAVIPLLPSFPFVCLALYGFSRSSERFKKWFTNTKFYKSNFKSLIEGRGMTIHAKHKSMITVTLLLIIGAFFARKYIIALIIIFLIWIFHIYLFYKRIKTIE